MLWTLILYIIVALGSLWLSKYEKKANIAMIAAPISIPLGILMGIGIIVILNLILTIIASIIGIAFFLGPLAWIIVIFIILSSIGYVFEELYHWILKKLVEILMRIRIIFDNIRNHVPQNFHIVVVVFELAVVTGLSLYSLWDILDYFDGVEEVTTTIIVLRVIVLIPYALLLYSLYIKDTNPPNTGGDDGVETPLLVEITDFVDNMFDSADDIFG